MKTTLTPTVRRHSIILISFLLVATIVFGISPTAEAASSRDNVRVGDFSQNLCLDVNGAQFSDNRNGAWIQSGTCGARASNKWTRIGTEIRADNGKCLDIHAPDFHSQQNGGFVQLWTCTGASNQQWDVDGNTIRARGTNLCLDVHRPHYDNGTWGGKVQMWDCNGWVNQRWSASFINSGGSQQPGNSATSTAVDTIAGVQGSEVSSVTCSSSGHLRNSCPTSWNITGVWVKGQRLSNAVCSAGDSFGFSGTTIWVDHGCRATFGISGTWAGSPSTGDWSHDPSLPGMLGTKMVVMGDSYASGEGITAFNDQPCRRDNGAYGPRLGQERGYDVTFTACSGMTTAHVRDVQVDQIPSEADIITLSIGGNDMGFSDRLNCFIGPGANLRDCETTDDMGNRLAVLAGDGNGSLEQVYARILNKAPGATLYVMTYPMVLDHTRWGWQDQFTACAGLNRVSGGEAQWADGWNQQLNATIEQVVNRMANDRDKNWNIEVIDIEATLVGTCQAEVDINRIVWEDTDGWFDQADEASFHPTQAGYDLILNVVRNRIPN